MCHPLDGALWLSPWTEYPASHTLDHALHHRHRIAICQISHILHDFREKQSRLPFQQYSYGRFEFWDCGLQSMRNEAGKHEIHYPVLQTCREC
jgi:hypothetical protein